VKKICLQLAVKTVSINADEDSYAVVLVELRTDSRPEFKIPNNSATHLNMMSHRWVTAGIRQNATT